MTSEYETDDAAAGELVVLFPLIYGSMGPAPAAGEPPELLEVVMFDSLAGIINVVGGRPEMLWALLSSIGAPLAGVDERNGVPPASKASIEAMKTVVVDAAGEGEDCPVCLEEMKSVADATAAELVKEMPCGHRFHGGCIGKWLGMHGSCPVCRYLMTADQDAGKKGLEMRNIGAEGDDQEEEENGTP